MVITCRGITIILIQAYVVIPPYIFKPHTHNKEALMSEIQVNTATVTECAVTTKQEADEWHKNLVSCHQKLADMIDQGIWQGTTAENFTGEYYNMIISRYINSGRDNLNEYARYLESVAQTYILTEQTNTSG